MVVVGPCCCKRLSQRGLLVPQVLQVGCSERLYLQSLAEKLDFLLIQFGKHAVDQVIAKVQKCFIPHLKALKGIYDFLYQKFRKL